MGPKLNGLGKNVYIFELKSDRHKRLCVWVWSAGLCILAMPRLCMNSTKRTHMNRVHPCGVAWTAHQQNICQRVTG